jgi:hypothetical protein
LICVMGIEIPSVLLRFILVPFSKRFLKTLYAGKKKVNL